MKTRKRFFCLFLVLAMLMCSSLSAFAAETNTVSSDIDFVPVEETDLSREDALEILGMTEEECEGKEIYVADISPASAVNPGKVFDSGYFSFSGTNVGSYRTMNGTVLAYAILWKPANPNSEVIPAFEAELFGYGQKMCCSRAYVDRAYSQWRDSKTGYYRIPTQSVKITKGLDYHFKYYSYWYDGANTGNAKCSIRVVMTVDG